MQAAAESEGTTPKRRSRPVLAVLLVTALVHAVVFFTGIVPADWVESAHAGVVFPALRVLIGTPASLVSFSVGQALLAVAILVTFAALAERVAVLAGLCKCRRAGVPFLWIAGLAVHLYLLGFGWLYERPPLSERLALREVEDPKAFAATAIFCAEQARASRCAPPPAFAANADLLAREALQNVLPDLGAPPLPATRAKRPWPRGGLMLFGVSGIYWPFTLEPHVDAGLHPLDLAFVIPHELAHLAGFASEDAANFVAWLACTRSTERYLQYAGHVRAMRYFARAAREQGGDLYDKMVAAAGPGVVADLRELREHWRRARSERLSDLQSGMWDAMLKAQGEKKGIASYGEMIRLVLAWRGRSARAK